MGPSVGWGVGGVNLLLLRWDGTGTCCWGPRRDSALSPAWGWQRGSRGTASGWCQRSSPRSGFLGSGAGARHPSPGPPAPVPGAPSQGRVLHCQPPWGQGPPPSWVALPLPLIYLSLRVPIKRWSGHGDESVTRGCRGDMWGHLPPAPTPGQCSPLPCEGPSSPCALSRGPHRPPQRSRLGGTRTI